MGEAGVCVVDRFEVPLDRAYHPSDHTWVRREGERLRVGMDALGLETLGDLAQLMLVAPGTEIASGDEMGSLEAQKFVGALRSPVRGVVAEVNQRVLADPRVVQTDPYDEGWLLVLTPVAGTDDDLTGLVAGGAIEGWFADELERYRTEGSVAE